MSENVFRDKLILEIISSYGVEKDHITFRRQGGLLSKYLMAASHIQWKREQDVCIAIFTMPETTPNANVLIVP